MDRQKKFFVVTLLMAILAAANAKEFYVAPNGSPNGDGTINNPWDLQTALNHPPQVQPGDIIWLRGGEYEGPFTCKLQGTEDKPIIVRAYPGERVILQVYSESPTYSRPSTAGILKIEQCSYVWFWGFEIRNHGIKTRWTDVTGSHPGSGVMGGVYAISSNNKIINLVVHDVIGNGMGIWRPSQTTEVYGNLIFNNGWKAPDRGHGHSIYTQNEIGTKYYIDNISLNPFSYALHAYGSSRAFLKNFYFEGNIFANGSALVGGLTSCPVENIIFKKNYFWNAGPTLGYRGVNVTKDLIFEENYIYNAGRSRAQLKNWQSIRFRKNKLFNLTGDPITKNEGYNRQLELGIGPLGTQYYDIDENEYYFTPLWRFPHGGFVIFGHPDYPNPDGTWFPWDHYEGNTKPTWRPSNSPGGSLGFDTNGTLYGTRPTGTEIFIRPNKYEPGRAHIIIFNWDKLPEVNIDISSVLPIGTPYEIRNAFDYFNDIAKSGIYDGQLISLDMVNRTVAIPEGWDQPLASSTYPEFGVFILLPKYPSIPQIISPKDGEQFLENPTFRLKAYDEFPIRFIIEITKDGETKTFMTDYAASGTEMIYTVPETLALGTYTVKIKAQNKYGRESPYAGPITITIKSPPPSPTLIEPKNGSVVTSTPTFRVKVTDLEGGRVKFLIEVKRNEEVKTFETDMVNSGEEATFTVSAEQALAEGTYTWRAKVKEEGLESEWSEAWNFTVNNPPSAPTLISPKENAIVSSTPNFKVKANDPNGERIRIRVEVLDKEGNILLQLTTPEVDSGQEMSVSLPLDKALAPGTYYWRAVASDRWMESPYSETRRFHVFVMSHRISKGLSFISIPLKTEQRWSDLLELPEDQLRVVTWDPISNRYVYASAARAPNGSAVDEIAARPHLGRGYWVKLDTDKEVHLVGHSIDREEVVVDLQPGWNIIGNPFTKPIHWNPNSIKVRRFSEVKSLKEAWAAGWLEGYSWGWRPNSRNSDTGSYFLVHDENILPESVSVMEPFNAYWVRAYVECQLVLEPPKGEELTKLSRQRDSVGNSFGICINAKLNDSESKAFIGVGGRTRLQATEPPTPPTGRTLQIVVSNRGQELVADVRDKMTQRMIWELTVRWMPMRGQQGEISLSFDGIVSIPKDYSVFLVDKTTGERRYLRTTPVYRFTPQDGEAERRFALLVEQNSNRVLRVLNLKAQPVRGQGVIVKFRLTKAAQTTTEILTLTGRTAAVIETGQPRPAGEQLLFWRGTNDYKQPVGVGAYLVRVHAIDEEGRQTQSFTIVRLR